MRAVVKLASISGKSGVLEVTESSGNRFDIAVDSVDVTGTKLAIGQRYEITFSVDLTSDTKKGIV